MKHYDVIIVGGGINGCGLIRDLVTNPGKKFVFKYPCHSPSKKHWFIAELSSFHEKENQCLTISHQEISERQFLAKI